MRLAVKVTPRAKQPSVTRLPDGTWSVKVRQPAEDGRANEAALAALAHHWGVPKRAVRIVQGQAQRRKIVEIDRPPSVR